MATSTLAIVFTVYLTSACATIAFTTSRTPALELGTSMLLSAMVLGILIAFRAPLRRISSTGWRAGCLVGIVVLANVLRGLMFTAFIGRFGSPSSLPPLTRMAGASLLALAAMILVGEFMDRRNRFRAVMTALTDKSFELSLSRATYSERLKHANAELEASIRSALDPALSLAAAELHSDTAGRSSATSARLLQEILRVSVRPMIQTLVTPNGVAAPSDSDLHGRIIDARPGSQRTIDVTDSIRPLPAVVPPRLCGLPRFIATLGTAPVIRVFRLRGLTWPLLSAIRRLWPERLRVLPAGRAIGLLTLCFIGAFAVPMLILFAAKQQITVAIGLPISGWLSASTALFSVATAWFIATVFIFGRSRRLTEAHLIEVNEQIEHSIARLRQEIWFTRRNLTWVLHGPVQSALVSATIRLQSASVLGATDRAVIWSNIRDAYELLSTTGRADPDFTEFAGELTSLWHGLCEISFNDPGALVERVAADPSATAALIEVVREAVGNAIRHGNATSVDVTILDQDADLVRLVITDNGSGMADGATPGIGSDLFTSLAFDWSSETSPSGTTITADLTWSPRTRPTDDPSPDDPVPDHERLRGAVTVTDRVKTNSVAVYSEVDVHGSYESH